MLTLTVVSTSGYQQENKIKVIIIKEENHCWFSSFLYIYLPFGSFRYGDPPESPGLQSDINLCVYDIFWLNLQNLVEKVNNQYD